MKNKKNKKNNKKKNYMIKIIIKNNLKFKNLKIWIFKENQMLILMKNTK